jgi:hypothetical protein
MPAMQFSIAPWDLSRETEKMVGSALAVRQKASPPLQMWLPEIGIAKMAFTSGYWPLPLPPAVLLLAGAGPLPCTAPIGGSSAVLGCSRAAGPQPGRPASGGAGWEGRSSALPGRQNLYACMPMCSLQQPAFISTHSLMQAPPKLAALEDRPWISTHFCYPHPSLLAPPLQLTGVLLKLANEAAHALKPICRPLWFLDPYDEATYTIYDQYALGDDVIVAPVVQKVGCPLAGYG